MKKSVCILCISLFFIFITACKKDIDNNDEDIKSSIPLIKSVTDGDLSDGTTIEITGVSFGTKSVNSPLVFVNSEGKTNKTQLDESSLYIEEENRYFYDDSQTHSKGMAIKLNTQRWPNGVLLFYDMGVEGTNEVYFTFWSRIDFLVGDDSETTAGAQIKWTCIRAEKNRTESGYGFYPWYWKVDGAFEWKTQAAGVVYDDYVVDGSNWVDEAPTENTWFRIEIYGKRASAPYEADGTWIVKCIEPEDNRVVTITDNTKQITHGSEDGTWRYVGWRNEITNASSADSQSEVDMWIDDIYIDNSRARVEMGDSPVFEDCLHREIQVPTVWTDSSIQIELNQGSFQTGDTVYLFVIDEAGNVSEGFEIVIGG